ncbi:DEAD (Asp-Glu-Ala-Asp) box helicase [Nesidiocoris tenuis]|uniref:DEAD (Asp-Glu-Ala-Asp) box helicase n=1 Tax=Nesidiocoris tenuis TaxID=355587 RepID=A0ABN7BF68_9HEMI|nr:DEAD (Asp-Glu-Ala-Asp) box helicase [Nesidiocoris tenuis]
MYVINYDFPNSSEDYIHRIGRTGRSNSTGTAYTFFTTANQRQAKDLVAVMREAKQEVSPELDRMSAMGFGGFGKGGRYGAGKFGGGRSFGGGGRSFGGGRGGGYGGKPGHKRF